MIKIFLSEGVNLVFFRMVSFGYAPLEEIEELGVVAFVPADVLRSTRGRGCCSSGGGSFHGLMETICEAAIA